MMLQLLAFSILVSLLLSIIVVVKQYWKKTNVKGPNLPPRPRQLPLIGNLLQLAAAGGFKQPHWSLRELAKRYGPVMHLQLGEISTVVISSAEAAKEALKTQELSLAQRPTPFAVDTTNEGTLGVVFCPYGDYWRQMRKICVTELLSNKRVQSFRSVREEEVWNFVESISLSAGLPSNISHKIFSLTTAITSRAAFGSKCRYQGEFIRAIKEGQMLLGGFDFPDLFPSLKNLHWLGRTKRASMELREKFDMILEDIINDHKAQRISLSPNSSNHHVSNDDENDFIDVLLNLQESDNPESEMIAKCIKQVALDMFGAGSETTSTTLEWAFSELLINPRAMHRAQAEVRQILQGKSKIRETDIQELNYLKSVVKETLRLHPANPLIPREARERCEINGYMIPKNSKVVINAWAIGRDPKYWTDADCFKPERFLASDISYKGADFEYIPFGSGRRMCPGISFAIPTIELALAQLLYHFDWKLANGNDPEQLDMTEKFGATVTRSSSLYLIASLYNP